MSVPLSQIETLVRYLLGDTTRTMVPGDIFTYENSAVFTLTEANVIAVTEVLHNDVALTSGQYSFDSSSNKLTITKSLVSGDTIEIQYTYYSNYSSTEVQNYVEAALVHLSVNNFADFDVAGTNIFPDPCIKEKNLIALVTATLMEPDNKSYRLPDLTITVPKDLPLNEKIAKMVAIAKRNTHGVFDLVNPFDPDTLINS